MRDLRVELKSLNADWRALSDAAESLDCGAPDVWTMLLIELRAARADTRLDDVLSELRAQTEMLSRLSALVASAMGADPGVSMLALSPEAARYASSQARSASPAASQSFPEQRDCSGSAEGAAP